MPENSNHLLSSGSRWHRWEPHVHAPGTILNDQFTDPNSWEPYTKILESAVPPIRAIGVTDYYSTNTYKQVCEIKQQGRLPNCDLIFPNIELRLGIAQLADSTLKEPWEAGDPQTIREAMKQFRSDNEKELLEHSPILRGAHADYRAWLKNFAKWLYGTNHISIRYSIDYDGVDIRKLSPGTRGIVLLLLYLALDDADDRPLIIDQPEESLDPKSVFDELVNLFMEAKNKRQVIMVTHNANLVVNTDADQIILAEAGAHAPGELPPINYFSGGLESAHIRSAVCDILEGGEQAFQERARRLRVRLDR